MNTKALAEFQTAPKSSGQGEISKIRAETVEIEIKTKYRESLK